jgi:hypothetical protein
VRLKRGKGGRARWRVTGAATDKLEHIKLKVPKETALPIHIAPMEYNCTWTCIFGVLVIKSQLFLGDGTTYLEVSRMSKSFFDGDYVGQVNGEKKHGKGKMNYKNGTSYEGEWADDFRHGLGVFTWPDGSRYEGHFTTGKMGGEGNGVYYDASGKKSDATWISAQLVSSQPSAA